MVNTPHPNEPPRTRLRCPVCTEVKDTPDEVVECMRSHDIRLRDVLTRMSKVGVLDNADVERWLAKGDSDAVKSREKTP